MSKLALIFPGQGSQSLGMLADVAAAHDMIRHTFEEASHGAAVDLWQISQQGPAEELNRTEFTQPALLAAGVAMFRLRSALALPEADLLAGHSLGEYTALVCAGAIHLPEAAALVRKRGQLMQEAVPHGVGAMAAILGADDAVIAEACSAVAGDEVVSPANFNSPGQTVIAGHAAAVDRAIARLAEKGVRKAVKLPVSVPSHCLLMRAASESLREHISRCSWFPPSRPVVQNADARAHTELAQIHDALVRQLYLPVRWTECVQTLLQEGASELLECGPGKVLAGLVKRIDKSLRVGNFGSMADLEAASAQTGAT
jgi:[acyl-carrier-protein] S-malonyltransferase